MANPITTVILAGTASLLIALTARADGPCSVQLRRDGDVGVFNIGRMNTATPAGSITATTRMPS